MSNRENDEQYIEDRIEYVLKNEGIPKPLIRKYIDDVVAYDDLHPYNIMSDKEIIEDFNLWYEDK